MTRIVQQQTANTTHNKFFIASPRTGRDRIFDLHCSLLFERERHGVRDWNTKHREMLELRLASDLTLANYIKFHLSVKSTIPLWQIYFLPGVLIILLRIRRWKKGFEMDLGWLI